MTHNSIFYNQEMINRAGHLRRNEVWLKERLQTKDTRITLVWEGHHLLTIPEDIVAPVFLAPSEVLLNNAAEIVFMGLDNENAIFMADLSHLSQDDALKMAGKGTFSDLRQHAFLLKPEYASMLVYGRGMINWHQSHQFCSKCGHKTISGEGGHVRLCINEACKKITYPRTDPAVIVLIEYKPINGEPAKCLLAKHQRSGGIICSTLAGFVEPGETLENAVKREMKEEVGLDVENIQYVASQPWPFPASVMLGFTAESNTTQIVLDEEEIKEAQWYSAQELIDLSAKGELTLSRQDSIARFLIESWINRNI